MSKMMIVKELWEFLKTSKRYWLLPILIIMMLFAFLIVFSQGAGAPFIYTLF